MCSSDLAGLLRPDRVDDVGAHEARAAAADIALLGAVGVPPKSVALIFGYEGDWVTSVQPQGKGFSALRLAFDYYSALRKLGLDVDIISPDAALDGYKMVVVPCLPIMSDGLVDRLAAFAGAVVIGARTGSKTADFAIPHALPPGPLQRLIPINVTRVESLRPGLELAGEGFIIRHWFEHVEGAVDVEHRLDDGRSVVLRQGKVRYVAAWPDTSLLQTLFEAAAGEAKLSTARLPEGLRTRRAGDLRFAFNYGTTPIEIESQAYLIGTATLAPAAVSVWRE